MKFSIVVVFFFLMLLMSCFSGIDTSCKTNYIGVFKYDSSVIIDEKYKKIIIDRKWDTVKLISDSTGKFFFESNDAILKKCEGKWYTQSNNIDGQCIGFIKQNNLPQATTPTAFTIYSNINDTLSFIIPFRKVQ